MIKLTLVLRRRGDLTHDEFVEYHRDRHAPLFESLEVVRDNVRRYVQQHTVTPDIPGLPVREDIDGLTELWFDDQQALERVFGDAEYLALVRPDEGKFLDMEHTECLLTEEHQVLGRVADSR
ncbi:MULTISPECIES: EthD domain-containing protein [unclassified Streptomyces]|uniref:EthD domain-containing protein n=1 Tax=unclassified Streptomyces TaxID=2593676 RepID=UPI0004BF2C86|nr:MULTISPECIES: EthD domain-containing protein [unclassified Streptomyces]